MPEFAPLRPLTAALVLVALAVAPAVSTVRAEAPSATLVASTVVSAGAITEASGLAASRANPGVLWVINDSGGEARVFALGTDGKLRCSFLLEGASAVDYEDVAIGPDPNGDGDALYVADIGDNLGRRASVVVYTVAEPKLDGDCTAGEGARRIDAVSAIELTYPDGARDAQALLVDPSSGDLLIASRDPAVPGGLYRLPASALGKDSAQLERVATVSVPGSGASDLAVTAGDIRADGGLVVLRTYTAAWAWLRKPGQSVAEAFLAPPSRLPVVGPPDEPQGEALAFGADGSAYFTLGEGVAQSLHRFDLND